MKRFNLKRLPALIIAGSMVVSLGACSLDKKIKDGSLPEDVSEMSHAASEVLKKKDNDFVQKFNQIYEENNKRTFEFDPEASLVVPIEEIITDEGRVGYKFPVWYHAYVVDESKPAPGMCGVLEVTDEYQVLSDAHVTHNDGTEETLGWEGAVAVYHPYYFALRFKKENPVAFDAYKFETLSSFGEDSNLYQLLVKAEEVEELAKQVYEEQNNSLVR